MWFLRFCFVVLLFSFFNTIFDFSFLIFFFLVKWKPKTKNITSFAFGKASNCTLHTSYCNQNFIPFDGYSFFLQFFFFFETFSFFYIKIKFYIFYNLTMRLTFSFFFFVKRLKIIQKLMKKINKKSDFSLIKKTKNKMFNNSAAIMILIFCGLIEMDGKNNAVNPVSTIISSFLCVF